MEEVIAGLEKFTFSLEKDVEAQTGTGLLPFQGMDKSSSAVCNFFAKGLCEKGKLCPFRHDHGEKTVVCKHWLRGLCRKGDQCKFLHQYDVSRMPECYFYSKFGECSNKECQFLHTKTASKPQDCPWYDQGFCKDGPLCKHRHVQRVMCINYLAGFCPEGPKCQYAHPKMNLLFKPSYVEKDARNGASPVSAAQTAPGLGTSCFDLGDLGTSQAPFPGSDDAPGAAGPLLPGAQGAGARPALPGLERKKDHHAINCRKTERVMP